MVERFPFVPRFFGDRFTALNLWSQNISLEDCGKTFRSLLYLMKWSFEITLLALFWLVVFEPFMHNGDLFDPERDGMIQQIITICVKPSVQDLITRTITIVVLNLIFNLILRFRRLTCREYHGMSTIIGYIVLQMNCQTRNMILILGFILTIFFFVRRVKDLMVREVRMIRPIYLVSMILIGILCFGEIIFPDPRNWQECRGIMMIMAMKTMSLSNDASQLRRISCIELLGYLLCPATVLFGPWISFETYSIYSAFHSRINWKWGVKMVQTFTYAMVFMVLSNCLGCAFDPNLNGMIIPFKWHEAFQNAFVFRASNYFIGYMSEFTMISAGFNAYKHNDRQGRWHYPITRPIATEIPRSMAVVVRNWNIPVHRFLKENVYIPYSVVSRGFAIFLTFLVSSMLHGLNTRITIILLSLGVLSHSQQVIQNKLSNWLNCCCRINACKENCGHRFGFWHPLTLSINGINMILNVIHLAYLGHIMDEDFDRSTIWDIYHTWDEDFGLFTHHAILIWFGTMIFLV